MSRPAGQEVSFIGGTLDDVVVDDYTAARLQARRGGMYERRGAQEPRQGDGRNCSPQPLLSEEAIAARYLGRRYDDRD